MLADILTVLLQRKLFMGSASALHLDNVHVALHLDFFFYFFLQKCVCNALKCVCNAEIVVDMMRSSAEGLAVDDGSSESSNSDEENLVLMKKNTLSHYSSELGQSGSQTCVHLKLMDNCCLICLSGIKRDQAIWNCKLCHRMFHLVCMQQWAKDAMLLSSSSVLSEHLFPSVSASWSCPACRGDYSKSETPKLYKCFCGKQVQINI